MSVLTESEMDTIRSKVTRNTATKTDTFVKKIGKDLYDTCISKNLLEIKSGKAKFTTSFWNELKPKKPAKKKATKSSSKSTFNIEDYKEDIQKIVNNEISNLVILIQKLDERISNLEKTVFESSQNTSLVNPEKFKELLRETYDYINLAEKRGGMVPIPSLWNVLSKKGITRNQFEKELFKLEKDRIIDLQTASDPDLVKEKEKSIQDPARGLINYVVWRR